MVKNPLFTTYCWINAESNCLITIKGHKENLSNHQKVRLINPAKNEVGRINKTILGHINMKLFESTKINQWENTVRNSKWFNSLSKKPLVKFFMVGIKDFCPSATQGLLNQALNFATLLVNTYIHTYIHTYLPTNIHTYIPAYQYTYIHTYIHT